MRKKLLVAAVASSALMLTAPLSASAHSYHKPKVHVINTTVGAPFSLALSKGRVFVADGATSLVSRVHRNGSLTTVASGPNPGEVAGLAFSRNGRSYAYTTTDYKTGNTTLEIRGPGKYHASADLSGYERRVNPDGNRSYGVDNASKCVNDSLGTIPELPKPAGYKGLVDSHPYAVTAVGNRWIVADAGGNDLLRVDRSGRISTVAILPRQPFVFTADIVKGLGLADCVIGVTYNWEPVPTDVELGRNGFLYVTTLAGGPEDPSFGARSKVYRVNPHNGRSVKIGSGLLGATNLALKDGQIYVAELFANRISVLKHGKPHTYVTLPHALSVEAGSHGLWAGTLAPTDDKGNPTGPGSIVHITQR